VQYTLNPDTKTVNAEMPLAEFQTLLRILTASGQQDFDVLVRHAAPAALVSKEYFIESERSTHTYKVTLDIAGGVIVSTSCECPDYVIRRASKGTDCKHIGKGRVIYARERRAGI
jgi:hypothetical protein